jgi:formate hydrogenlyase subunit 3/multisubunit Na+/H+ antiporter MnhD subunit
MVASLLPVLTFLLPGAAGLLILLFGRRQAMVRGGLTFLGLAATLLVSGLCAVRILAGEVLTAWHMTIHVDGLSVLMQVLGGLLVAVVVLYSIGFSRHDPRMGDFSSGRRGVYYGLVLLFLATMNWTCSTNNIIMLWVSLQATTLAMTFLVTFYWRRESIEAGYKYLLLVAVGVAFGLLGCVLIYSASLAFLPANEALLLSSIRTIAHKIPRNLVLLAAAFFIAGFPTKAGLVPFHAWVPDAHSEAPAPVSALLSGILLKIGAYVLARTLTVFAPYYDPIVVFIALLASVGMHATIFMAWTQDDLKRLLAYHSVSQMGYVIEGLGIGTYLGIYGGLFHLVNHTVFKSLLFLSVGAVMYATGGLRRMSQLGGLGRRMPIAAFCFFVGALAMGGMPPFNGFMSKFTLFLALGQRRLLWAAIVSVITGLLTLACMVHAAYKVFWGQPAANHKESETPRRVPALMYVSMLILAAICVLFGVYPQILYPLLDSATRSILSVLGSG